LINKCTINFFFTIYRNQQDLHSFPTRRSSDLNATSQLTFILNVDWGQQENVTSLVNGTSITAKWDGAAAYANYQVNDQWRLSVRAEYFDDKDGYRTGVIQKWKEATLTLAYLPTKFIEIRGEVRGDKSDSNAFVKDTSFFSGTPG